MKYIPLLPDISLKDAFTGMIIKNALGEHIPVSHINVICTMLNDPLWSASLPAMLAGREVTNAVRSFLEGGGKAKVLTIDDTAAKIFATIASQPLVLLRDKDGSPSASILQLQVAEFVEAVANPLSSAPRTLEAVPVEPPPSAQA